MKRVCYPINIDRSLFNTNNIHQYDPYMIDENDILIIDKSWWKTLSDYAKELMTSRLKNYSFKIVPNVPTPHDVKSDDDRRLIIVYQTYQDSFDYHVWGRVICPPGVKMIRVLDSEKKFFINKDLYGLDNLKSRISENLDGKEYFLRTSSTSGKNDKYVRPFTNAEDILSHLFSVKEFYYREFNLDKETYLILIPWNSNITARNEFRIFVQDRKICGASPQKWWECHNYTEDELDIIESTILDAKILKQSPYDTFIADVYIDFDKKICNLIEINCTGSHSGAGSSLFNWLHDTEILSGLNPPELRYISLTSYG